MNPTPFTQYILKIGVVRYRTRTVRKNALWYLISLNSRVTKYKHPMLTNCQLISNPVPRDYTTHPFTSTTVSYELSWLIVNKIVGSFATLSSLHFLFMKVKGMQENQIGTVYNAHIISNSYALLSSREDDSDEILSYKGLPYSLCVVGEVKVTLLSAYTTSPPQSLYF